MSLLQTLDGQIIFIPSMTRNALRHEIAFMIKTRGAIATQRLIPEVTFAVFERLSTGKAKHLKSFHQVIDANIAFMDSHDFMKVLHGHLSIDDALRNGSHYKPESDSQPSHPDLFHVQFPIILDLQTTQSMHCI